MTDRIEQLRNLLEADPGDAFCLYSLAQEYAKAGEPQQAIAYFDRTIEADPAYCYAYYHKARVLEDQGDLGDAKRTLETGLDRAKQAGDQKAIAEIGDFLQQLG
jgi:tetratricopeptide (TPR) repeat protein